MTLLLAVFGTYGISTLLADYDGPYKLFDKLRAKELFKCSVCITPYVAAVICLFTGLSLIEYLAVTGASIMLARHL